MKQLLSFIWIVFLLTSCEVDWLTPQGGDIVPDTQARIARQTQISSFDGKTVTRVGKYQYNPAGQLEQINWFSSEKATTRTGYETYTYDAQGQLIYHRTYYQGTGPNDFSQTAVIEYQYPATNRVVKLSYYLQSPGKALQLYEANEITLGPGGRPVQARVFRDDSLRVNPERIITYVYDRDGRLIRENWLFTQNAINLATLYSYKGQTGTVSMQFDNQTPNTTSRMWYDRRGRLIREEPVVRSLDDKIQQIAYIAPPPIRVFEYVD
ncbi:hypothetical protein F5984_05760 [Rudanella paleaurantiibacter]|uniref:YD repeat-containing protein n=1 Tax=Rudanella paleaurantiibacter TaxID=2614655 RepID=A0A7J5U222_9BACT|nr:hypothetical protein [Rudanella paleaurantiibacter]KAB7731731.1 hypothetical protein F5984_05760 [Rudanella paleaurantiibacter]